MVEVTIKIPENIKDVIPEISETIYVEALKEVACKKISNIQSRLEETRRKIAEYELKYGKSYNEFSQNVHDTVNGHDDWIEWSYLVKLADKLSDRIGKLKVIIGK